MNIPAFYRYLNIFKYYIYQIVNVRYYSVVDLVGRTGENGEKITIDSYYPFSSSIGVSKGFIGGGKFIFRSGQAKSGHNGITIISPTVPWDGAGGTSAAFRAKTGETDPSGSGCWVRQFTELDITMAGAISGNLTFDNAPIIEACLAIDTASGLCKVNIPDGTWYINSTIDFPSGKNDRTLRGFGSGSLLYRDGDYGDTFAIKGNSVTGATLFRPCVTDLRITSAGLTTSGSHFNFEGVIRLTLANIYMSNGFKFVTFNGASGDVTNVYGELSNLYGGTSPGRKFMEFGDAPATYAHQSCSDLFIRGVNGKAPTGSNFYEYTFDFSSADGIWITGGHAGYATTATVRFNPSGSSVTNLVWFADFMFDETGGIGTYFDGAPTGVYTNIFFDECNWKGGGTGTIGFATSATCNAFAVYVNGGSIIQMQQEGVQINSPDFRSIYFNEVDVRGNSKSVSNTYSGYKLADGVQDIYISGGRSGADDNRPTDANTQKYGIETGTGHSNVFVNNVDLRQNLTGTINSAGANGVHLTDCPIGSGVVASTTTQILGHTERITDVSGINRHLQVHSGATAGATFGRFSADDSPNVLSFLKSKHATIGSHTVATNGTDIVRMDFAASDGSAFRNAAQILVEVDGTPGASDMPGRITFLTTPDGSATPAEKLKIDNKGLVSITGSFSLGEPVTKTADFTVADTENYLVNNKAGSTCTVTLPNAASYPGRVIRIKNIQAQLVVSASANVVPIDGSAATTSILAATAGKYAVLVSRTTNWEIMEAN